ncbi:MAG: hypothetical protein IKW33_01770, partial [Clostridia bacterium]|nr:hypothetical protein [Clostridia bacterium]
IPTISEKTFVYTGETQKPTILESKLYTIVNNGGVNVGTYQVVISLADSTNYNWSNGNIEDITYTYYIEKATNEFTLNPNLSKITWVYGEEQGVATLGKSTFGNVSVVYVDGENNQYNVIPTNAGEYKAVFSVVGTENYYYLEAEIIFVIKKASVNLPTSPQNKSYTGSKLVADVVENSLYTIVNNGGVNVGEYNVTYTLKNDVNYKWADEKEGATRTYVFAITKATNSWALNPSISKNTWAYGEEAGVLNIGNASFGMPNIKYIDQNNKEYKEAPTNVGTYRAVVSVVGTENYTALTTTINFTIEKVILTITAPQFVDTIFYENKVDLNNESNFVALPTIDKNVLGEFVYELPLGQQIEDGKVKVKVTFITVDSVNYQVASEVYATINVKTVATIGSVNYGSIESALLNAVSGDVVWVTAGDVNIEITSDCEILSDVILNIPYEGKDMNSNGKAELTDKTVNNINALTVVTVKENVTLTNYGTIQVTGQLSGGGGGGAYAGHTAGKTAKVVLKANAIINNVGGTIKLFGLILESYNDNGSQVIIDGGNLYMPFVVRDFRGGSYMYAVYDNKQATAFNEFELRNITSLVTVKNSANVYGYANLATSKLIGSGTQQNATTINLVSTNSTAIIHFANNNGYLTSKYNITDDGYTGGDTWADGILDLDIFGGATAEAMSLKVNTGLGNTTVSTENVFFPISWRLNISLNGLDGEECNYTMNYKYKIMPGGVFTVGEGANLTIKTLAVYTQQAITDVNDISTGLTLPYSETVGDGQFIVETGGSVTITKGNVGGAIKVVEGGSFVNNGTSSVTAYEVKELTGSSIFANCKVENINLSLTLV